MLALPPVKPTPRFELLRAPLQLRVISLGLFFYFSRYIHQPVLASVGLAFVATVPLVIGKIEPECVLLIETQLLMRHIVVPADEVDGIAKIISICPVIA